MDYTHICKLCSIRGRFSRVVFRRQSRLEVRNFLDVLSCDVCHNSLNCDQVSALDRLVLVGHWIWQVIDAGDLEQIEIARQIVRARHALAIESVFACALAMLSAVLHFLTR